MGPFVDALCTHLVIVSKRAAEFGWKPAHERPLDAMPALLAEWRAETAKS
jgi:hypothetical protein